MRGIQWAQQPQPAAGPDAVVLGGWEPVTARDLTWTRRQLSAALHDDAGPVAAVQDAVDRLLLCYEELASNALRHGRPTVRVQVISDGSLWLLDVSDADPDTPPVPATDRDPAHGGMGLQMVAEACAAHGWWVAGGRKHVWAQTDSGLAQEPVARDAAAS